MYVYVHIYVYVYVYEHVYMCMNMYTVKLAAILGEQIGINSKMSQVYARYIILNTLVATECY